MKKTTVSMKMRIGTKTSKSAVHKNVHVPLNKVTHLTKHQLAVRGIA